MSIGYNQYSKILPAKSLLPSTPGAGLTHVKSSNTNRSNNLSKKKRKRSSKKKKNNNNNLLL